VKELTFSEDWELALREARIHGKPGHVWNLDRSDPVRGWPIPRLVARTMHPSFMSVSTDVTEPSVRADGHSGDHQ